MVKAERYIFLKNIDLVLIHSYVNGLIIHQQSPRRIFLKSERLTRIIVIVK